MVPILYLFKTIIFLITTGREMNMKKITKYFLEGLLLLVPLFVTLYVFYFIFTRIDNFFKFETKGLGFIVTIVMIIVIGYVSSSLLTSRFVEKIDASFSRLPLVKMIYTSIKDLINAFVGDKKRFNRPVLVEIYPGSNVKVAGFITSDDLKKIGIVDSVAVYLPQSYNFAGFLIVVPKEQIEPLDVDSGRVMAFIVSGGVTFPGRDDADFSGTSSRGA